MGTHSSVTYKNKIPENNPRRKSLSNSDSYYYFSLYLWIMSVDLYFNSF